MKRALRLALVTIGQAPRPDLIPDIADQLAGWAEITEHGALDGLSTAEIRAGAPASGERALHVRLGVGEHAVVAAHLVDTQLEMLIAALDRRGYDMIALVTTGVYRSFASQTPLVHGQRAVDAWIAALLHGACQVGVIYPLAQQVDQAPFGEPLAGHSTLLQDARTVSVSGQGVGIAEAAAHLRAAELIFMHSVGYTEAMAREAAASSGRAVVTARRIIAAAVLLQVGQLLDRLPPVPAETEASGPLGGLLDRLPQPDAPLTPREREVLVLALTGQVNKLIARALGISHRTVEIHRARALTKYGASSSAELIRRALIGQVA